MAGNRRLSNSEDQPVGAGRTHRLVGTTAKGFTVFGRTLGVLAAIVTFIAIFLIVTHELGSYRAWGRILFALFMASGAAWIAYGFGRHWLVVIAALTIIYLTQRLWN
jgi:hypothetical protein